MNKRVIVALGLGLLLLFPVLNMGAEPEPGSNTGNVTDSLFLEDNDTFLDPLYFHLLDSSVLFLQMDLPQVSESDFQMGGGLLLDSILISAYYGAYNLHDVDEVHESDLDLLLTGDTFEVLGKSEEVTESLSVTGTKSNDARAMVGLSLGPVNLGARYRFDHWATGVTGTLAPTFTFPNVTTATAPVGEWFTPSVGAAASTGTTTTIYDAAGTAVFVNADGFGVGYNKNSDLGNQLEVGARIPLGGIALLADLDVDFRLLDYDAFGEREQYLRDTSLEAPSFTPPVTLNGGTPVTLDGLTSFTYTSANTNTDYVSLSPAVTAGVEIPIAVLPYPTVLTCDVNYDLGLRLYNNDYLDTAGAQQSLKGRAYYGYFYDYTLGDPTPTGTPVTTVESRMFQTDTGSYIEHIITPRIKAEMNPSERFRFAVEYSPQITMQNQQWSYAGSAVQITTYEDGDGVDGNAAGDDSDDYVETTTVSMVGRSTTEDWFQLNHRVETAVQFFLTDRLRINAGGSFANDILDDQTSTQATDGTATQTVVRVTNAGGGGVAETQSHFVDSLVYNDGSYDARNSAVGAPGSSIGYRLGFTFFFSPEMYLDARFTGGGTTENIFETANWNFEVNIKFPPRGAKPDEDAEDKTDAEDGSEDKEKADADAEDDSEDKEETDADAEDDSEDKEETDAEDDSESKDDEEKGE